MRTQVDDPGSRTERSGDEIIMKRRSRSGIHPEPATALVAHEKSGIAPATTGDHPGAKPDDPSLTPLGVEDISAASATSAGVGDGANDRILAQWLSPQSPICMLPVRRSAPEHCHQCTRGPRASSRIGVCTPHGLRTQRLASGERVLHLSLSFFPSTHRRTRRGHLGRSWLLSGGRVSFVATRRPASGGGVVLRGNIPPLPWTIARLSGPMLFILGWPRSSHFRRAEGRGVRAWATPARRS